MSVPNSNAWTNLTTPSMYDDITPFDVSPNDFGEPDFGQPEWPPLFFDDNGAFQDTHNDVTEEELPSLTSSMVSLDSTTPPAFHEPMIRQPSNTSINSHDANANDAAIHRLSLPAGISKSTRRTLKDLAPISLDIDDEKAVKRARNTLAARKSRQKKRDVEDTLREQLEVMTAERDKWKMLAISLGAPLPDV